MCMFCKNSQIKENTVTHVVNHQNCTIIVKNVPCLECKQCGEKYYADEVAERLENIIKYAGTVNSGAGYTRLLANT